MSRQCQESGAAEDGFKVLPTASERKPRPKPQPAPSAGAAYVIPNAIGKLRLVAGKSGETGGVEPQRRTL
jgi:hypothetical protein